MARANGKSAANSARPDKADKADKADKSGKREPAAIPEPRDVVDGIPDRSVSPRLWKYVLLACVFVAWVSFLLICLFVGSP
jgi:hypothetical protein